MSTETQEDRASAASAQMLDARLTCEQTISEARAHLASIAMQLERLALPATLGDPRALEQVKMLERSALWRLYPLRDRGGASGYALFVLCSCCSVPLSLGRGRWRSRQAGGLRSVRCSLQECGFFFYALEEDGVDDEGDPEHEGQDHQAGCDSWTMHHMGLLARERTNLQTGGGGGP
jgi:hypothetical protein